eukprot:gene11952-2527_t
MNGNPKVPKNEKSATGGDAPKEAAGKIELIDQQPTGQNTTEIGDPPRYPLNVESAEAQAHESRITGCRDHPDVFKVCAKAKEPCFCAEHESYTYSYCRRSCKFCDPKVKSYHKFWRLRAASSFNPSWMISKIEFYRARGVNLTMTTDTSSAYASSNYDPGFNAAKAFDDDPSTMWMPSGWSAHSDNDDWIGYEFPIPVHIGSLKLIGAVKYPKAAPGKVYVEAANEKYGPFETKWMIRNPNFATEKVFSYIECDVLWRRYETGESPICFRLIAKYKTWMDAQKECQLEGGELASVTSVEEQEFIMNEVKLCGFTWLGLNDRSQEGSFVWTDGSNNSYSNWKENQAYDEVQRHYEDCVAMDPEGNWYTFSCQDRFYFLCKKTLVDPEMPIPEKPPAPETPPVEFIAPNFTMPVVVGEAQTEEEEQTTEDVYNDMLASISMSRMKELGLKPPESIANLESLPPNLGEKLNNLTEQALKHINKKKINMNLKGTEKLIEPPPGLKKPRLKGKGGNAEPGKITVLRVPSSPGQELVEEVPGVKPLQLPGEENDKSKENKNKENKNSGNNDNSGGQKVKPPPAQEGGKSGEQELSVGESGEEGPPEGQEDEEEEEEEPLPLSKNKNLKKITPKKLKSKKKAKKAKKEANMNPGLPQIKKPDVKIPQQPVMPSPASPNYYGIPGFKKHKLGGKKDRPFSITFAGKKITNVQTKNAIKPAEEKEDEESADEIVEKAAEKNQSTASESETETAEAEAKDKTEEEVNADESSGNSGSGIEGFDPDLDEEFLDMAVDDLL